MTEPEPSFPVGSRVRFEDDLDFGDFVYLDRHTEPGVVLIRRLHEWQARAHEGQVYRFAEGREPKRGSLRPVRWVSPASTPPDPSM
jgi:hypothetical protein